MGLAHPKASPTLSCQMLEIGVLGSILQIRKQGCRPLTEGPGSVHNSFFFHLSPVLEAWHWAHGDGWPGQRVSWQSVFVSTD